MTDFAWTVQRSSGPAATFHDRPPPLSDTPPLGGTPAADKTVRSHFWVHQSDRRALVLGSAQSDDLLDADAARAAGWEVCRRHSGGGLVIIVPGTHVWVDLVISNRSPLWNDDIVRAFDWVGELWADAIGNLTGTTPLAHRDRPRNAPAGRLLCFAGLGAGEIAIGDRKILGLSQRRTRTTARFQTMLETHDHTAVVRPFARGALAALIDSADRPATGLDPNDVRCGRGWAAALTESDSGTIRHEDIVGALLDRLGVGVDQLQADPVSGA